MRLLLSTTTLFILSLISAFYLAQFNFTIPSLLSRILPGRSESSPSASPSSATPSAANMTDAAINLQALQQKWRKTLDELPSTPR
ncbi:hypothetical protein MSAN_01279300 [Mycena sanguinolenta]|uniref:Uncharacterized protein n=1 Tax=Mycena sanguinolenta TaxID=230812 RepID=A0A8H7D4T3_9AGAR|nr:hypothetical protein MSAN_01279300 [Mycena sanguinolenta]